LAEETLVSDSGYAAAACATEPSQVFVVQKAGFVALLRNRSELCLSLLRALSAQFQWLVGRLDDLTLKDVQTRVADWLLEHCSDPESLEPQTAHVPETKRLLASELGTSSETLSRTLAKLRDQNLLSVQGKTVTLLCPLRLAQLFRDNAGTSPPPPHRRPDRAQSHAVQACIAA
jgi:CRP/FNR family transcriptional regulator